MCAYTYISDVYICTHTHTHHRQRSVGDIPPYDILSYGGDINIYTHVNLQREDGIIRTYYVCMYTYIHIYITDSDV